MCLLEVWTHWGTREHEDRSYRSQPQRQQSVKLSREVTSIQAESQKDKRENERCNG